MMRSLKYKLFWVVGALLAIGACGNTAELRSGETHFLQSCTAGCAAGYECLCGVCTLSCEENAACEGESDAASCEPSALGCEGSARVCDVGCENDADCAEVGDGFQCQSGQCRDADYEAPEPEQRELCDGSSEARLFINSVGGFVESSYSFTNPYGHLFMLVTGECEYWAGPAGDWQLGHGVIEDPEVIEELVGWDNLVDWTAFDDTQSCPDAGNVHIYAPNAVIGCACGCDDGAPAGLSEALSAGLALAGDYANEGGTIDAVQAVTFAYTEDNPPPVQVAFEWPLATPISDFLAEEPFAFEADSGQRVEVSSDVELLRELALANFAANASPIVLLGEDPTCSSCPMYGLLVRDELPEAVAQSLTELRESP
jgi:hypothetical protein